MSFLRHIDITRAGWVRWALLWLGVVWMLASSGVIVVAVAQHNRDLEQIQAVQQQYVAEQSALSRAGREQAAFAGWLVVVDGQLCSALHVHCPPLPPLPPLPGVKP